LDFRSKTEDIYLFLHLDQRKDVDLVMLTDLRFAYGESYIPIWCFDFYDIEVFRDIQGVEDPFHLQPFSHSLCGLFFWMDDFIYADGFYNGFMQLVDRSADQPFYPQLFEDGCNHDGGSKIFPYCDHNNIYIFDGQTFDGMYIRSIQSYRV